MARIPLNCKMIGLDNLYLTPPSNILLLNISGILVGRDILNQSSNVQLIVHFIDYDKAPFWLLYNLYTELCRRYIITFSLYFHLFNLYFLFPPSCQREYKMAVIRANKRVGSILVRSLLVALVCGLIFCLFNYKDEISHMTLGQHERRNIPSVLIIGAKHCNLGYLTDMLQWHPQLVIAQKTGYFDNDDNYAQGLDWYLSQLPKAGNAHIIERSDEYYAIPKVPARVAEMNPDMKIIFEACDPLSRALKHYHYSHVDDEDLSLLGKRVVNEDGSAVNEQEDVIHKGMYTKHLAHWLQVFPKEQFFITDSNTIFHEPVAEMKRLENFLGITHTVSSSSLYFNKTRGTYCGKFASGRHCFGRDQRDRGPKLIDYVNDETLDKMKEFYKTHNEELVKVIGKEFTWVK